MLHTMGSAGRVADPTNIREGCRKVADAMNIREGGRKGRGVGRQTRRASGRASGRAVRRVDVKSLLPDVCMYVFFFFFFFWCWFIVIEGVALLSTLHVM